MRSPHRVVVRHLPLSPTMILLVKSETHTIQGRRALVNSVCQSASPRKNDFASGIKNDEDPGNLDEVWDGYPGPS